MARSSLTELACGLTTSRTPAICSRLYGGRVAAHTVDEDREEAICELVGVRALREPGVGPVRRRENEQDGGMVVEIRPQSALLATLAEERAKALLVAPALGKELLGSIALEVAPLADEDRRDIELLRDDPQVRPERALDPLGGSEIFRHRVECGMERLCPLLHRLVEQILLRVDVGVERTLLDPEGFGEVADRRAVVAALGEEPRRLPRQLRPSRGHERTLCA